MRVFGGLVKDSLILGTALHLRRRVKKANYNAKRNSRSRSYPIFEPSEEREFEVWPPE
jgi:hypothetical protein